MQPRRPTNSLTCLPFEVRGMRSRNMTGRFWPFVMISLALAVPLCAGELVYPVLQEPRHKPVFHNDSIDVYDARLEPGEESAYHVHSRDQLGIVMRSTVSTNQVLGSSRVEGRSVRGSISYIPHSVLGNYTHRVRVNRDGGFRVIGIEFARSAGLGATRITALPDQARFEFPQGAITRIAIPAGESREIGGALIVPMSAGTLRKAADGERWKFAEGDVRWIGGMPAAAWSNESAAEVSLLLLTMSNP